MSLSLELAEWLNRDLGRLHNEIIAFPGASSLWEVRSGVTNSAGNLALHLEGNLREFVGRQLGGIPYQRQRDLEFSSKGLEPADLAARIAQLRDTLPDVVAGLSEETLSAIYPEVVLKKSHTTRQFLIHLLGHLNYHLGQINYLRRIIAPA